MRPTPLRIIVALCVTATLLVAGPASADTDEFVFGAPGATTTTQADIAEFHLSYSDHLADTVDPWKCYVRQPFLVHQRRTAATQSLDLGAVSVNCHNRNLENTGPIDFTVEFQYFNFETFEWTRIDECRRMQVTQPTTFGQGVANAVPECRYDENSPGLGSWHRMEVELNGPVDLDPTYSQPSFAFRSTLDVSGLKETIDTIPTCFHLDCPASQGP